MTGIYNNVGIACYHIKEKYIQIVCSYPNNKALQHWVKKTLHEYKMIHLENLLPNVFLSDLSY